MKGTKYFISSLVALFFLSVPSVSVRAQESTKAVEPVKTNAVYLEIGGPSGGIGVSYEKRFGEDYHWGWRAGLSFGYSSDSDFLFGGSSQRDWFLPIGVNYLVGNLRNALELGFGVTPGIINEHSSDLQSVEITHQQISQYPIAWEENGRYYGAYEVGRSRNFFGYFFAGDIAYRHTSRRGFLFKVGVTPAFSFGDDHGIDGFNLLAHLNFGWVF